MTTRWQEFVAKLRNRTEPAPMTALPPGFSVQPDPPDTADDLPGWLAAWEQFAERRKAS